MTIKHFLKMSFILSGRGQTTPHFVLPSLLRRGIKGVVNCKKGVQE